MSDKANPTLFVVLQSAPALPIRQDMPDTTNANTPVEVSPQQKEQLSKVRRRLVEQFSKQAVSTGDPARDAAARQSIEEEIPRPLRSQDASMPDATRAELVSAVVNELFGFGPIQ